MKALSVVFPERVSHAIFVNNTDPVPAIVAQATRVTSQLYEDESFAFEVKLGNTLPAEPRETAMRVIAQGGFVEAKLLHSEPRETMEDLRATLLIQREELEGSKNIAAGPSPRGMIRFHV